MKGQSKLASLWESWQSTVIGFVLALVATRYVGPFFGVTPGPQGLLGFTLFMTVLSVARGYAIRRWNEHKSGKTVPPDFRHIIEDFAEERWRQISKEGFTAEDDDALCNGELARGAAAYAYSGSLQGAERTKLIYMVGEKHPEVRQIEALWPKAPSAFKGSPRARRDLVKAGAMLVAEIGRLDRMKRRA